MNGIQWNQVESRAWGQRCPWELNSPRNSGKTLDFPRGRGGGFGQSYFHGLSQRNNSSPHACHPHTMPSESPPGVPTGPHARDPIVTPTTLVHQHRPLPSFLSGLWDPQGQGLSLLGPEPPSLSPGLSRLALDGKEEEGCFWSLTPCQALRVLAT